MSATKQCPKAYCPTNMHLLPCTIFNIPCIFFNRGGCENSAAKCPKNHISNEGWTCDTKTCDTKTCTGNHATVEEPCDREVQVMAIVVRLREIGAFSNGDEFEPKVATEIEKLLNAAKECGLLRYWVKRNMLSNRIKVDGNSVFDVLDANGNVLRQLVIVTIATKKQPCSSSQLVYDGSNPSRASNWPAQSQPMLSKSQRVNLVSLCAGYKILSQLQELDQIFKALCHSKSSLKKSEQAWVLHFLKEVMNVSSQEFRTMNEKDSIAFVLKCRAVIKSEIELYLEPANKTWNRMGYGVADRCWPYEN